MYTPVYNKRRVLKFKQFNNHGYSLFSVLGKEVDHRRAERSHAPLCRCSRADHVRRRRTRHDVAAHCGDERSKRHRHEGAADRTSASENGNCTESQRHSGCAGTKCQRPVEIRHGSGREAERPAGSAHRREHPRRQQRAGGNPAQRHQHLRPTDGSQRDGPASQPGGDRAHRGARSDPRPASMAHRRYSERSTSSRGSTRRAGRQPISRAAATATWRQVPTATSVPNAGATSYQPPTCAATATSAARRDRSTATTARQRLSIKDNMTTPTWPCGGKQD